jgi:hypothetical protein
MALKLLKFSKIAEANFKMNGGIAGGVAKNIPYGTLVGKTITFATPAGSHAFTASTINPDRARQAILNFQDVKKQLEDNITNLEVLVVDGHVAFRDSTGGAVTLAKLDQPARSILGLPNEAGAGTVIAGQVINPPSGAVPKFVGMSSGEDAVFVMIEE